MSRKMGRSHLSTPYLRWGKIGMEACAWGSRLSGELKFREGVASTTPPRRPRTHDRAAPVGISTGGGGGDGT